MVQPFRRVVLEENSEGELDGESDDGGGRGGEYDQY